MAKHYLVVGCDMSVNSPGIVALLCDEDLSIIRKEYLSFTSVKKYVHESSEGIILFNDKKKKYNLEAYDFSLHHIDDYRTIIDDFIHNIVICDETPDLETYAAFEDYAFSASGNITDLAEMCHGIKDALWKVGVYLRVYNIASIKIFATGKGNADKIAMEQAYNTVPDAFDLSFLPGVYEKKAGNPKDNIVDSAFIAEYLRMELKLRNGILTMKDLSEDHRKLFNRVTKSNPFNVLSSPFIHKDTFKNA